MTLDFVYRKWAHLQGWHVLPMNDNHVQQLVIKHWTESWSNLRHGVLGRISHWAGKRVQLPACAGSRVIFRGKKEKAKN